jgi:hypothetical protein
MVIAKKKSAGCWTCRLRRKKCDKIQPQCGVCTNLEINCHFNAGKPEWMVREDRRREMAESIKKQIKHNATGRRERKLASVESAVNSENGEGILVIELENDTIRTRSGSRGIESAKSMNVGLFEHDPNITNGHTRDVQSPNQVHEEILGFKHQTQSGNAVPQIKTVLDSLDRSIDGHMGSTLYPEDSDYETDFIMKYLDYVFPSLFPFYQPAIFETGRSWMLSLLRRNKTAFHSALSLTSYFFTIALTDAYEDAYADCTSELWSRLENQTDKCFKIIHTNMLNLNFRNKTTTALEKVYMMESIIQVLMFEVVLGRSVDWNLHLTPALALFEEVVGEADSHDSKMISVLHSIGLPTWYKAEYGHYMWNPDQAGFRFFAALLIFVDIIASTALVQTPKLSRYHSEFLARQDDGAPILGFTHLRLSTMVGCQNSVMVAIGQIAALDAWKQKMKHTGSLSMLQLLERSAPISISLNTTLDALDSTAALQQPQDPLNLPFHSYAVRCNASAPSNLTTRIWTVAAQVYITVVISGWQPSNAKVWGGVSHILELLHTVPSNHLRTLAWPLCVAGCLASIDQEQGFRNMFAAKKKIELLGSLNEARRVMERVWESRGKLDAETWDLAACFSILEKPVLLI